MVIGFQSSPNQDCIDFSQLVCFPQLLTLYTMKWPSMPLLLQDQCPQVNDVEAWTHYQICTACPAFVRPDRTAIRPACPRNRTCRQQLRRAHQATFPARTRDCATSHIAPSTRSSSRRLSARFRAGGRCRYDQTIALKEKAFAGPPCRARDVPSR